MKFHDQDFENQEINLDDNVYTGCAFRDCKVVFKGTGAGLGLMANKFEGCYFELQGPAAQTLEFMRLLFHGGAPDVVNGWISMITAPPKP